MKPCEIPLSWKFCRVSLLSSPKAPFLFHLYIGFPLEVSSFNYTYLYFPAIIFHLILFIIIFCLNLNSWLSLVKLNLIQLYLVLSWSRSLFFDLRYVNIWDHYYWISIGSDISIITGDINSSASRGNPRDQRFPWITSPFGQFGIHQSYVPLDLNTDDRSPLQGPLQSNILEVASFRSWGKQHNLLLAFAIAASLWRLQS